MAAATTVCEFRIPADLESVHLVRRALERLLERQAWPADCAGRVVLGGAEALANAVEHGSPAAAEVLVEVAISVTCAHVRVVDEGLAGRPLPRFPDELPPPTALRGRGLVIMRELAESAELLPAGVHGTEVRLYFERRAEAERRAA